MKKIAYKCPIRVLHQLRYHSIGFELHRGNFVAHLPNLTSFTEWVNLKKLSNYVDGDLEFFVCNYDLHKYKPKQGDLIKYGDQVDVFSTDADGIMYIGENPIEEDDPDIEILKRDELPWLNAL